METPCVNVCSIDPVSRLCSGCGRTIDEIASWASMAPDQRRRIMRDLPKRRHLASATGGGR